jgi:hypothetical protein
MTKIITNAIKGAAEWKSNIGAGLQINKNSTKAYGGLKDTAIAVAPIAALDANGAAQAITAPDITAKAFNIVVDNNGTPYGNVAALQALVNTGDMIYLATGTDPIGYVSGPITDKTKIPIVPLKIVTIPNDDALRKKPQDNGSVTVYNLDKSANSMSSTQVVRSPLVNKADHLATGAGFGEVFLISEDEQRMFVADDAKVYQLFKNTNGDFVEKTGTNGRITAAAITTLAYDSNYLVIGKAGTISIYNVKPTDDSNAKASLHATAIPETNYGGQHLEFRKDLGTNGVVFLIEL